MGYAFCGQDDLGRDIGYSVVAECDEPGCSEAIDRGLGHLCGEMHGDDLSCNRYFCGSHLEYTEEGQRCARCADVRNVEEVMES